MGFVIYAYLCTAGIADELIFTVVLIRVLLGAFLSGML